jgi:hypothetical protein
VRVESERVLDMLEAIERIRRHAEKGRTAFEREDLITTRRSSARLPPR